MNNYGLGRKFTIFVAIQVISGYTYVIPRKQKKVAKQIINWHWEFH